MSGPATPDTAPQDDDGAAAQGLSPAESRRVKTGLAIVVIAAVVGLGGLGVHWWTVGRFVQSTNDAFLQADQVAVAPKVAGYVEQVLVADNQEVAAGQPLVRIDVRDPQARLDQAKAQVDQGLAGIAQAQAQIHQQEASIAQAQAQLKGARASAAFAAQEVDRYGPLAQSGAETKEHLDQLRQNRDQANAQAAADEAQVAAAQRQIETLKAQIQLAQAQTEQARAAQRQAGNSVEDAVVRASIAGRIGDRTVRPGQYVQPGLRMMSVVPVQAIYLVANFKETQIGRMRPGQPVEIKVDALGGEPLKGVIDSFSPGTGAQFALIPANNATGNFTKIVQRVPVRIRVDAPARVRPVLLPGLSVDVKVDTRDLDAAQHQAAR
ncbi:MAG: HlyD family secretion protein [Caulobacteraceae bacterium]|nr:HlyD family secretion protein [Caulobacteraceae bacterium]